MKTLTFSLLLFLCSCFTRPALMTRESYDEIQLGEPISEVRNKAGRPYSIRTKGPGKEEYEYIERIDMGGELLYETHYYLLVIDGKVVKKRFKQERPPAYDLIYEDDPNYFD
jgi:hypothetical protein